MTIAICYTILGAIFLALATGIFRPRSWQGLPEARIKLIRFGCLFFAIVIILNLARTLFSASLL